MDLQLSESSGLSLVYEGWEWGNWAGVAGSGHLPGTGSVCFSLSPGEETS